VGRNAAQLSPRAKKPPHGSPRCYPPCARSISSYTPSHSVLTSDRLDTASGASLFFKCENFQRWVIKAAGAHEAVFSLDDETAQRGRGTQFVGEPCGGSFARGEKLRGIAAHIVMPSNSSKVKVRAVEGYGGRIVFCEPNQRAREETCARVIAETGATMIHPFENENVMAGQGNSRDRIAGGRAGSRSDSLSGGRRRRAFRDRRRGKKLRPASRLSRRNRRAADDAGNHSTSIGSLIRNRKIRLPMDCGLISARRILP